MSNRRVEEIKRRITKRKREKALISMNSDIVDKPIIYPDYDSQNFKDYSSIEEHNQIHPLFNVEKFLFKVLGAAILVLVVAILFKDNSPQLDQARSFVSNVMEQEFQFAAVAKWYEETFGEPLALLPSPPSQETPVDTDYAIPAAGSIVESFSATNEGILIQTLPEATVEAVQDGTVIFAGVKADYGYIVIVQHADNSESWYGNLSELLVNDYDKVEAGQALGVVSKTGETTGEFYFALKQGEEFVDPVQVIQFE